MSRHMDAPVTEHALFGVCLPVSCATALQVGIVAVVAWPPPPPPPADLHARMNVSMALELCNGAAYTTLQL